MTIRMRNKCPGNAEHARVAFEWTRAELGQLPVIACGQIGADLTDLFFDEMVIIHQPFGRGCNGPALADGFGHGAICQQQPRPVIRKPAAKLMHLYLPPRHWLCHGKTAGMLS